MNELNPTQNTYEAQAKLKFKSHEWVTVKNEFEELKSKYYIKKDYLQEQRTNSKKLRFNKRNPTKYCKYYEENPLYKETCNFLDSGKSYDRIYQNAIPNTITYAYEGIGSRIYNCNFTSDGRLLFVTTQHGTSTFKFFDNNTIELSQVISCPNVNWAITDSDISTDNKMMIQSTLSPNVHFFDLEKSNYSGSITLKSNEQENNTLNDFLSFFSLRVYSVKLSGDGQQFIAGCGKTIGGAPIQVYDLESNKVKNSIIAHSDDINSVTYLNKENSSIFISTSDDGVSKLWDTRILENNKPVGIFYGHVSGVAYVSSKEDGRYFITNCKDQSIKLWDIRKSTTQKMNYPFLKFDYRYEILSAEHIEEIKKFQQKVDNAVMTFWGHQVHMSLIRCHFSPAYGTAQRYIYSGSYDGRVYIYDTVTGQNVACLEQPNTGNSLNSSVIRDVAWHPHSQTIINSNFLGELYRWEYFDLRDNADKMEVEEEVPEDIGLTKQASSPKSEIAEEEPIVFERSLLRDNL